MEALKCGVMRRVEAFCHQELIFGTGSMLGKLLYFFRPPSRFMIWSPDVDPMPPFNEASSFKLLQGTLHKSERPTDQLTNGGAHALQVHHKSQRPHPGLQGCIHN